MEYLHYEFNTIPKEIIRVVIDRQANVMLMDSVNYAKYCSKKKHEFVGGLVVESPLYLKPPHPGHWHIVIDSGGFPGKVSANVNIIKKK